MKKYIIEFQGEYLVEMPNWNGGKWTEDKTKATIYDEPDTQEFYTNHYPQFTLIEVQGE